MALGCNRAHYLFDPHRGDVSEDGKCDLIWRKKRGEERWSECGHAICLCTPQSQSHSLPISGLAPSCLAICLSCPGVMGRRL